MSDQPRRIRIAVLKKLNLNDQVNLVFRRTSKKYLSELRFLLFIQIIKTNSMYDHDPSQNEVIII